MTNSAHTHVTPDLPPAVKVPDLPGEHTARGGERPSGEGRPRKPKREQTPQETDGPVEGEATS